MSSAPKTTKWALPEHSKAKHDILREYLAAWTPIVGRHNPAIALIDGFAGPGRYTGGEIGSPLIMLEAYADRPDRHDLRAAPRYVFVERDQDRCASLREQVAALALTSETQVHILEAPFDDVLDDLLADLGDRRPIPVFMFVDPFGYEYDLEDIGSFVGNPRCEALIFLPTHQIARFVTNPKVEANITRALHSQDWLPARAMESLDQREVLILSVFVDSLRRSVKYVLAFHVESAPTSGYDLVFATSNRLGVNAMKDAMWKVDPTGEYKYREGSAIGQTVLFTGDPDPDEAAEPIRRTFGTRAFSIEEAEERWLTTHYRSAHLRQWALKPLEKAEQLAVDRPAGKRNVLGQYPLGTRLRLLP